MAPEISLPLGASRSAFQHFVLGQPSCFKYRATHPLFGVIFKGAIREALRPASST